MLSGIVLVVFLFPMVLGQLVEYEQECHVLRTLDNLETRLQEQDARLKLQETLLEHQKAHSERQEARIAELEAQINASKQPNDDHRIGFTAYYPADASKENVVRFIDIVTNEGGVYNRSTGEFNCTVAGLYSFSLHLTKSPLASAIHVQCGIYRNDVRQAHALTKPATASTNDRYYEASASAVLRLFPGDVVYPGYCSPASSMNKWSSFSGFLIRADGQKSG